MISVTGEQHAIVKPSGRLTIVAHDFRGTRFTYTTYYTEPPPTGNSFNPPLKRRAITSIILHLPHPRVHLGPGPRSDGSTDIAAVYWL